MRTRRLGYVLFSMFCTRNTSQEPLWGTGAISLLSSAVPGIEHPGDEQDGSDRQGRNGHNPGPIPVVSMACTSSLIRTAARIAVRRRRIFTLSIFQGIDFLEMSLSALWEIRGDMPCPVRTKLDDNSTRTSMEEQAGVVQLY
jgi:hypothetical protein